MPGMGDSLLTAISIDAQHHHHLVPAHRTTLLPIHTSSSSPNDLDLFRLPTPPLRRRHTKSFKRSDAIWGAWFFFAHYFKPVAGKPRLDAFLVQHDMESMYMWVFKERPENALGRAQLRSFMNGHSPPGEPRFPFTVDRGFLRSHRMQRKHYRGLSNPQCLHGIEVVHAPSQVGVPEADLRRWVELTGRETCFSLPPEASAFDTAPVSVKSRLSGCHNKVMNGSRLNLSTQGSNRGSRDELHVPAIGSKHRKDTSPTSLEQDDNNLVSDKAPQDAHMADASDPSWINDFAGVMRRPLGPVTAAKTIYEDSNGYLIIVSLPFADIHRVKVSWKNTASHGIIKISCSSIGRMPFVKRRDRTFRLADTSPEHCPPGSLSGTSRSPLGSRKMLLCKLTVIKRAVAWRFLSRSIALGQKNAKFMCA